MAEIKSTLELALERTKHLVMSDDEKKQMKLEESLEKLPGTVQQYIDGVLNLDKLVRTIEEFSEEYRDSARKRAVKLLLDKLELSSTEKIVRAIDKVADSKSIKEFAMITELHQKYLSESASLEKSLREKVERKLASKKVTGDCFEIIPEKSREFQNLRLKFEKMLADAKNRVLEKLDE